jgi:hypothetical protein
MKHAEFFVGDRFYMYSREYVCVDKGEHYIIAAEITDAVRRDPSWLNGPPLAVAVHAFDGYDIQMCSKEPREFS